jgi:HK97 gp10 family phage protein
MGTVASVSIHGSNELIRALKECSRQVARVHAKTALRAGAEILQKATIAEAPEGKSGKLRRDIKIRNGRGGKDKVAVNVVSGGGSAFYSGFVDEGHYTGKRVRVSKKVKGEAARRAEYHRLSKAKGRTFVAGKHYMEKGFDQAAEPAAEVVCQKLGDLILQEMAK